MNATETEAGGTETATTVGRRDRILAGVGKAMVTTGTLMLLFVAYQLWGTGLAESRAQSDLKQRFTQELPRVPTYGDPVTRILIPSIDVDKIVVAGVDHKALEKGPGLFDGSPLPGQLGNVAIAGHRTSFGAPFARINELSAGDEIVLTRGGDSVFTYVVTEKPFIVPPTATEVVKTLDDSIAELTLVSCHPKWTAQNRIIVRATLESSVTPQPATVFTPAAVPVTEVLATGWFREPEAIPGAVALALALVLLAAGARVLVARGRTRWRVYGGTAVLFGPTLFLFFGYLSRLLPANI